MQQQQNTSEMTEAPEIDESLEQGAPDTMEAIAALLAGEEEQQQDSEGEDHQESDPASAEKPLESLSDLAEKLGVKVEDLYGIQLSFGGDGSQTATIGELKDVYAEKDSISVQQLEWEQSRQQQENQLLRANQELQLLMSALPKTALSPEVMEHARQKHEASITAERRRALEVIPEWRNEEQRTQELQGMVEFLHQQYGLPQHYLGSVYDHRSLKVLRDFYKLTERVNRALEQVRPKAKSPTPARSGSGRKPAGKASQQKQQKFVSSTEKQVAQIVQELGGSL